MNMPAIYPRPIFSPVALCCSSSPSSPTVKLWMLTCVTLCATTSGSTPLRKSFCLFNRSSKIPSRNCTILMLGSSLPKSRMLFLMKSGSQFSPVGMYSSASYSDSAKNSFAVAKSFSLGSKYSSWYSPRPSSGMIRAASSNTMMFLSSSGIEAKIPGTINRAAKTKGPRIVTRRKVFLRTRDRNSR